MLGTERQTLAVRGSWFRHDTAVKNETVCAPTSDAPGPVFISRCVTSVAQERCECGRFALVWIDDRGLPV